MKANSERVRFGVSVVICCYNSALRLPDALKHLLLQQDVDEISWEIIVVDNGSTDNTATLARNLWPSNDRVPLTVISEPRRGVAYAREAGFDAANFEFISFIDDDNWVGERWIKRVVKVMADHPEVGACGGYSDAICEGPAPQWFERFCQYYAVGPTAPSPGSSPSTLWFAGLTVRSRAWRDLRDGGFHFLTVDGAEDCEFTLALRLAGWKLGLDDELRMSHVMPSFRLTWRYFCALQRSRFASLVAVDPYQMAIDGGSETWLRQVARTLKAFLQNLILRPQKFLWPYARSFEGDDDVFRIQIFRGRLLGLIRYRQQYDANVIAIANAVWRNTGPVAPA